jgi:RNA polymerase sigma-70 factor (ECF subfamily)
LTDLSLDIIKRAQAGDEAASRELIDALHRPVLATIYRFLGSRYRSEYEDIAQDIFLKLFRSIERFDPERGVKFTTWTFTFVRNHCFDLLKKRRISTTSINSVADEDRSWDLPDPAAPAPGSELDNSELGERIEHALAGLSEDQRLAFVLREYEGLEYRVIASVMGVSEGTIKSRLHRAKEAMRQSLAPYLRTGS